MRLQILFILGIFAILLSGCVESNTEGTNGSSNTDNAVVSNNKLVYSVNELIEANNVSFKVTMWGYSNRWEAHRPPSHAKYLWAYGISENVGSIPEDLPTDFLVIYKGVNATPTKIGHLQEYDLLASKNPYFPGATREGFVLFYVPEDLKDDEATLMVDINGQKTKIKLSEPTRLEAAPLSISNGFVYCEDFTWLGDKATCDIGFSITNTWPVPYNNDNLETGAGERLYANYSVNDEFEGNGEVQDVYMDEDLNFFLDFDFEAHEQKDRARVPWSFSLLKGEPVYVKCNEYYCSDRVELGKPGDQIKVTMVLYESDGTIVSDNETFYVTLPDLSEK